MVDCVEPEENANLQDENPNAIEFDNLYLDMNGIIHPCCHPEGKPAPPTEEAMFKAIFAYIDRLFAIVRPRRLLYMGIDGVAPRAKMNQQRARRFRAAKEMQERQKTQARAAENMASQGVVVHGDGGQEWDSNVITPGTPFMHRLSLALRAFIADRISKNAAWKKVKVIFSDANSPGEGEHKIMDFIRRQRAEFGYNPNQKHCLYGLDADLIMLGLATHEPNFYLIRETVEVGASNCFHCGRSGHKSEQCPVRQANRPTDGDSDVVAAPTRRPDDGGFQFLRIPILREYLRHDLDVRDLGFKYDFERVIDDFVFLCFFVGNDFLPHLPSLSIRDGSLELLMDVYKDQLAELGGYLTQDGEINFTRTLRIVEIIGNQESRVFAKRHENEVKRRERVALRRAREKRREADKFTKKRNPKSKAPKSAPLSAKVTPLSGRGVIVARGLVDTPSAPAPTAAPPSSKPAPSAVGAPTPTVAAVARAIPKGSWKLDSSSEEEEAAAAVEVATKTKKKKKKTVTDEKAILRALLQTKSSDPPAAGTDKKKKKKKKKKKRSAEEGSDDPNIKRQKVTKDDDWLPGTGPGQGLVLAPPQDEDTDDATPGLPPTPSGDGTTQVEDGDSESEEGNGRKADLEGAVVMDASEGDSIRLWERGWKERYYQEKCGALVGDDDVFKRMQEAYAEGLAWVLKYYYQGVPSWGWYYPFHYAPFASDLVRLRDADGPVFEPTFELGKPFSPIEQLMAVLPPASAHALPPAHARLMTDMESPIIGMYPEDFKIDMDGTTAAWQGVVILPFVDEKALHAALREVEDRLSADELERNALRPDSLYLNAGTVASEVAERTKSAKARPIDLDPSTMGLGGVAENGRRALPAGVAPVPGNVLALTYRNPDPGAGFSFKSGLLPGTRLPPKSMTFTEVSRTSERKKPMRGQKHRKNFIAQGEYKK